MQLSKAAINEHEAGHGLFFLLQAFVAARDYLAHGGEIVHAFDCADDEFAVIRLLHLAVFPHHHRGHSLRALDVRDVEALDAFREFGQADCFLQLFLNFSGVGFQHAKTLVVGLFRVGAGEIEQRTLVSSLGNENMNQWGAGAPARGLL